METVQYRRPQGRRSSLLPLACGCLAALAILGTLVVGGAILFLPQIGARLIGLSPQGDTSAVFADVTPQPTIQLENPTEPAQVTVNLGEYGQQTFTNNNPSLYDFTVGTGAGGGSVALATFTEQGINELCRARTTICSANSGDPRFRNARIDLRPGGAVVYADVTIPELGSIQQTAGIVLRWDAASRRAVFAGIDYNGTLYSTPPQGLGATITEIETRINELVQQLSVDAAGSGVYTLAEVQADDTLLTLVLR